MAKGQVEEVFFFSQVKVYQKVWLEWCLSNDVKFFHAGILTKENEDFKFRI